MEALVGDIVIIPFPFSDLSQQKRRPAYVAASFEEDIILCQITSSIKARSILLSKNDFSQGELPISTSFIRPDKLFTASKSLILKIIGQVQEKKKEDIQEEISELFTR